MIKSSPAISISSIKTTPFAVSLEMGDLVQAADREQKELEKKLLGDKTRTKASRALFSSQAGEKRTLKLWDKVAKKQDELKGDLFKFNKLIDSEMKVAGTTDMLILQNYATLLHGYKVGEVMDLVRDGDKDALRACLLLPVLKTRPQFKEARELFTTELTRQVLGDDYEIMQGLKEQQEQANQLEAGLLQTASDYKEEVKRISAGIVDESEMPELG